MHSPCLSIVRMQNMNSYIFLILKLDFGDLGGKSQLRIVRLGILVRFAGKQILTPPLPSSHSLLWSLSRIMWKWTLSRSSVWRTGRGVTRFPPVKVRKPNGLIIRIMSSLLLLGSKQRSHKGDSLAGSLWEGWVETQQTLGARQRQYQCPL